jgi:hypothetical protein
MSDEDYCSGCAGAFPADQLTERGSELLCAACAGGKTVEDPELAAMRQRLGTGGVQLPGVLDLVVTAVMTVALGVGWGIILAPSSFWWALFLAVAPGSIGIYLKLRADTENRGTLVWALILGGLLPILGFVTDLIAHGESNWLCLVLIPFGAAVGLLGVVKK